MHKQVLLLLPLTILSAITFGQPNLKRRSVYFEIAGSGGLGSINYERHFFKKKNTEFTWRAGFSIAPIDKNNGVGFVFPVMINSIIGKTSHKLELGVGQGVTLTTKGIVFSLTTAVAGYRYQSENKPWFYRVSYTPLISYIFDLQVQHWAGVSIGHTLNNKVK